MKSYELMEQVHPVFWKHLQRYKVKDKPYQFEKIVTVLESSDPPAYVSRKFILRYTIIDEVELIILNDEMPVIRVNSSGIYYQIEGDDYSILATASWVQNPLINLFVEEKTWLQILHLTEAS